MREALIGMTRGFWILILFGCSPQSTPDQKGHWVSPGYFANSRYQTLDINDSTIIFNKLGLNSAALSYFNLDNGYFEILTGHESIIFHMAGDTLRFDNAWIGDSLFVRVKGDFYNSDVLCDLYLSIELPTAEDGAYIEFTKDSIVSYIGVGKLKSGLHLFTNEATDSFGIQAYDVLIKADELDDFLKMERARLRELDRDRLVIALFADKNVEWDCLNLVVNTLRKFSPSTIICLAYYNEKHQKFVFKEFS